jgi:hypothetical protein
MLELTRRQVLLGATLAGSAQASIRARLPRSVPPGVAAILERSLAQPPSSCNTDWFGTMLVDGLLDWDRRGIGEVRAFADAWLSFHLESKQLTQYSGPRSRPFDASGIAITTYAGHYGLAVPCYRMAQQYRDRRARQICLAVADIILHRAARNRYGMVNHDDNAAFAIPDTCYFVAPALMMAAALDAQRAAVYREQAVYQLRTYADVFLNRETGLARTILLPEGPGKTYWTRATGWLLWAITGVLAHLPEQDREFAGFVKDLETLAAGVARVQDAEGGLHVFLDDPASPLETSGTAMCARALHWAAGRGWLPAKCQDVARRGWAFVTRNLADDGSVRNVYTGWAVPAEQRKIQMDKVAMNWIPGLILSTACEMA